MDTLLQDLKYAVRMLVKTPGFTLVAILALALGIGANTAIFTVINGVLLEPLAFPEPQNLVHVLKRYPNGSNDSFSLTQYVFWRDNNQVFESLAAYDGNPAGCSVTGGGLPEHVSCIRVSPNFFHTLGLSPQVGRAFTAEENLPNGPRVAMISSALWKKRFGSDPNVTKKTVEIASESYQIVGVGPADFHWDPNADIWMPLRAVASPEDHANLILLAGRMRQGLSTQSLQPGLDATYAAFARTYPGLKNSDRESLSAIPLRDYITGDIRLALLMLGGAVGFVLLIACANVANLMLARAAERTKEVAVRAAMGASRSRIVRQLLTESVLLSLLGALAGLVLAHWCITGLLLASPGGVPRIEEIRISWRVLLFTTGAALLTGIGFGLVPALQLSNMGPGETLKESGRSNMGNLRSSRLRAAFAALEIALALVLVIGAGLLIDSYRRLRGVDLGFNPAHVLTLKTSLSGPRFQSTRATSLFEQQLVKRLESVPGVKSVASTISLPTEGGPDLPFEIDGRSIASKDVPDAQYRPVTARYFETLGISLKLGRSFLDTDQGNTTPVVIINERIAKEFFKGKNPIGERLTIGRIMGPQFHDPPRQIIGIVSDVHEFGPSKPVPQVLYLPKSQMPDALTLLGNQLLPSCWIIQTKADPAAMANTVLKEIYSFNSQTPVSSVQPMLSVLGSSIQSQQFNMTLLVTLASLSLILAAIGIYGVVSYSVSQRTHEIGIRMALGGLPSDMLKLIVGHALTFSLVGVAAGLAAAFGLTRFLNTLVFGVTTTDPWVFSSVSALLVGVSLLASYLPARRATRVDPMIALRQE